MKQKLLVSQIQNFSLHDGPGIRTTVFLQGCNLRCKWCHNPETWKKKSILSYTENKCIGCGQCIEICPSGAQQIQNGQHIYERTLCTVCGKCVEICCTEALEIVGSYYSVEELSELLLRDRRLYEISEGGVTFSGGEPLLQPGFLKETLKLCKNEGIHTCIDTAGYGLSDYDEILNHTDLVLLDLKHIHKTDYEKMTGRSMDRFEEFLNALKKHQTNIWIRHVVVPGITDSEDHMAQLKAYIQTIPNVEKVELLPYHLLGTNKYKVMDIPYSLEGVPAMDKKKTEMLQQTYFDHVYFMEEKSC